MDKNETRQHFGNIFPVRSLSAQQKTTNWRRRNGVIFSIPVFHGIILEHFQPMGYCSAAYQKCPHRLLTNSNKKQQTHAPPATYYN